jgi:hypothetical protein
LWRIYSILAADWARLKILLLLPFKLISGVRVSKFEMFVVSGNFTVKISGKLLT